MTSQVGFTPLPVLQTSTPDTRGGMVIDDKYVWIADHKNGLWRVDRCTGANSGDVSSKDGAAWDLWWYDPYGKYPNSPDAANPLAPDPTSEGYFIFEAGANGTVYVFNTVKPVASTDKATFITSFATGAGIAYGIYATEASLPVPKLYVATTGGVKVYNISNPFSPTLITTLLPTLDFVTVRGIAGQGYVYANSFTDNKTYVIDIATNTVVSSISYGMTGMIRRSWVYQDGSGNYFLYVVNDSGDLWIVNINNPLSPTIITSWNSPAGGVANMPGGSVYVKDDFAYVLTSTGNDKGYLYQLDVSNPALPVLVSTLYDAAFGFNDIRIDDCEVHIAAHDGWKMYLLIGWQPDVWISNTDTTNFIGQGIFESPPPAIQIKNQTVVPNETAVYQIRVYNNADRIDRFQLIGTGSTANWNVQYLINNVDVTAAIVAGTYKTPDLNPNEFIQVTMNVTPNTTPNCGDVFQAILTASSQTCPEGNCGTGAVDSVMGRVTLGCPELVITKDDGKTLVSKDETVSYVIEFSNVGNATATNVTITDILPNGMTYISANPVPNSVVNNSPNPGETTLSWNIGNLLVGSGNFTITLNAKVDADVVPGTDLTNIVRVNYQDIMGNIYPQVETQDTNTVLELPLTKQVNTENAMFGDTLTYTLTPSFSENELLSNVRIIDTIPSGTTYLPGSVTAGGTFGAYTPLPAVPGVDTGPPQLTTNMTVSTNFVNPGNNVTVTLNVFTSGAQVLNVSPTDLAVTGGDYNILSGPTPASATVPSDAGGQNFQWVVQLLDEGEYVFSAGAADIGETVVWPDASSSSVLSSAGGPNVVTWNLGSNLPSVNGVTLISGVGPGIYAFRGRDTRTFWRYDVLGNTWSAMALAPGTVKEGGSLAYDGNGYLNGYIYALRGDGTAAFWRYDIDTNTWLARAAAPATVKNGGAVVYLDGFVYALRGNGSTAFWRYNPGANSWAVLANTPAQVDQGGALTTDGTYIYAFEGKGTKNFWRYDPGTNTWSVLAPAPQNVKWGGALTRIGNFIYATRGDDKKDFWRYNITSNTWSVLAPTPGTVKEGGALTTDGTNVFALRGDNSTAFWRYNPATNAWTVLAPTLASVQAGGSLAFVEGNNPQVRITELAAGPTLVTTGDTIDITMTLFSFDNVTNVVPSALTITSTGGATAALVSGPTPASQNVPANTFVTYTWQYLVTAGANPGTLRFSGNATGDGPTIFPTGTSNSLLVSPDLTYQVTINTGAKSPITNTALFIEDNFFNGGIPSNEVVTNVGGSIGDLIWYDQNGNGIKDFTEPGISNVTVSLTPPPNVDLGNGLGVAITTVTDINGNYLFTELPVGQYTVDVVAGIPAGMVSTTVGPPLVVNLAANEQFLDADFGYNDSGVIGDTVFADYNDNGIQDPGEPGLPNVTVKLWQDNNHDGVIDDGDTLLATTVTDVNGNYSFTSLPGGDYIVAVDELTLPAGYEATTVNPLPVTLAAGETNNNIDFGFTDFGSICGVIWNDANRNGIIDPDEMKFANVQVVLTGPTGTVYMNTDANGAYCFENLPIGNYTVTVNTNTLPLGYEETFDPDGTLNNQFNVNLGVGQNVTGNFGYDGTAAIGDRVWNDVNGNGLQEPGEAGIPGVTVWLYEDLNANGQIDPGEPLIGTDVTDINGNYNFTELNPGNYVVLADNTAIPLQDKTNTTPNPVPVNLLPGQINNDVDFGFGPFAQIGDFVWHDINANGIQDPGEPGIPGATVTITPPAGVDLGNGPGVPISTLTDANGFYLFDTLPDGQYTVAVTTPGGYAPTTVTSYTVNVAAGDYSLNNDFGFRGNGSIGDLVWNDLNGNGIPDPGEPGIGGVPVYLFEDANGNGYFDDGEPLIGNLLTAPDGSYTFNNLPPGQYLVVIQPTDYPANTGPTTPTTQVVPLAENENYTLADFGFGPFSAIGDTVFFDANKNGVQDTGTTDEYGIPGATVNLYMTDASCNPISGIIDTGVTDQFGHYFFGGLQPGFYKVEVDVTTIPTGLAVTTPAGAFYCINLAQNQYNPQVDFGLNGTSSIGDFVWNDLNGNGIWDLGEPGVPGVTIELWQDINNDGILDTGIGGDLLLDVALTDLNGNYTFNNLNTGTYFVKIIVPPGFIPTTPMVLTYDITVNGTVITDADFGIANGEEFIAIGDFVWLDLNGNGLQDPGEPGIAGVTVNLMAQTQPGVCGPVIAQTVTDISGHYTFTGLTPPLTPGSYCVQVDPTTLPAGMALIPTLYHVGNDPTIDSDSNNGAPAQVTVISGYDDTIDFGYLQVRTDLAVTKTHDISPVLPGGTVHYTIDVTNNGPNPATNVVLTDTLQAGVTFVSAVPDRSSGPNPLVWNIGNMAVGETRSFDVSVTVNAGEPGFRTNIVNVSSDEFDPLPGNNEARDTVLLAFPSIQIIKYVSVDNGHTWIDANVSPGPNLPIGVTPQFKFVITNTGNVPLTNITVNDNTLEIGRAHV